MSANKKVFVGMSGGVDSTVACILLLEQGYEVEGVTLELHTSENKACGSSDSSDAREMARLLGIKHHIVDQRQAFKKNVIDYLTDTYIKGQTPNPCIACNMHIKFGSMLDYAQSNGADYIATGHYAVVSREENEYVLKKAQTSKDQSYVLYHLTQEKLSKVLFPLANISKEEVRAVAQKYNLPVFSKPDSQDICFISDNDYAGYIKRQTGRSFEKGLFVDQNGKTLGEHKGIIHYTVGQRKGLGISFGVPMYVKELDAEKNLVVLCEEGGQLSTVLYAERLSFVNPQKIKRQMKVKAKTRYNAKAAEAVMTLTKNGQMEVMFSQPQRAVTPGQAVVLYDNDIVLGGGIII